MKTMIRINAPQERPQSRLVADTEIEIATEVAPTADTAWYGIAVTKIVFAAFAVILLNFSAPSASLR
jgi:hypothetical protein